MRFQLLLSRTLQVFLLARILCGGVAAAAQLLPGDRLVDALQQGRYVLVMRHASSPRSLPSEPMANADNTGLERQLDDKGRAAATAMGRAIVRLGVPIGEVHSSPTYRARETVRFLGFDNPQFDAELGDRGRSMEGVTDVEGDWLRDRTRETPTAGNVLIVTHQPNIAQAFPTVSPGVADGETLVFKPDGSGGASLVGRIRIEEWPGFR